MAELKVTMPEGRSWKDIAFYAVGALLAIAEQLKAVADALREERP